MAAKDPENEQSEDACVFCGRRLVDGDGRFIMPDAVCCAGCHEDMKLEQSAEDGREGE